MAIPREHLRKDYFGIDYPIPEKGFEISGIENICGDFVFSVRIDGETDMEKTHDWIFYRAGQFVGHEWWIFTEEEKKDAYKRDRSGRDEVICRKAREKTAQD